MIPSRFVILHHVQKESEHWDLMLEQGGVLLTWQLPVNPTKPKALPVDAIRIADHRTAYLDYEGPISGGRGSVTRIERGVWNFQKIQEFCWHFEMFGDYLKGHYCLKLISGDSWRFQSLGDQE